MVEQLAPVAPGRCPIPSDRTIVPSGRSIDYAQFVEDMKQSGGRLVMGPGHKLSIILPVAKDGYFRLEGLNKKSPLNVTYGSGHRPPSRIPVQFITIQAKPDAKLGSKDRVAIVTYVLPERRPVVSVKFTVQVLPWFCGNDIP